jgi:TetR/AcrR family transcriptional repressor of nem operon
MGRTSNAKEKLYAAAIELIWTGSFGSTSIDEICNKANLQKGSFYHFFSNKTQLASFAFVNLWEETKKSLNELNSPLRPPLKRLLATLNFFCAEQLRWYIQEQKVLGCPIHSLGLEISLLDDELRCVIAKISAESRLYLEAALRDAMAMNEVPPFGDVRRTASLVHSLIEGMMLRGRIENNIDLILSIPLEVSYFLQLQKSFPAYTSPIIVDNIVKN